jgi:hypothetical protein
MGVSNESRIFYVACGDTAGGPLECRWLFHFLQENGRPLANDAAGIMKEVGEMVLTTRHRQGTMQGWVKSKSSAGDGGCPPLQSFMARRVLVTSSLVKSISVNHPLQQIFVRGRTDLLKWAGHCTTLSSQEETPAGVPADDFRPRNPFESGPIVLCGGNTSKKHWYDRRQPAARRAPTLPAPA